MSKSKNGEQTRETNTKTRKEKVWLKPEQISEMRNATVSKSATYLSARNDSLIALLADTGLRAGEVVQVQVDWIDFDDGVLVLPGDVQKQYPNGNEPETKRVGLDPEVRRTLRTYLNSRWKASDYLFPSRQSDSMTTESVRNVVKTAAIEADVNPYVADGAGQTSPDNVSPHSLRHSVAYRLMNREGEGIYRVKQRLRHSSVLTTEREYAHFDRV
ncbi:tyrosine-type recombinase/integrase [Halobium palmae]|uniref:Tyrosine-type recombinase/integrase n=1 Tax=Halobium palmae TaxID=1776492 RepID=A0ABD5RV86_9EURY